MGKQRSRYEVDLHCRKRDIRQGEIRYKDAIADAVKKGISVNTIHCGDRATGIHDYWQDAAVRGNGKFFNIDSDERIRYIETPFDAQIILCNDRLTERMSVMDMPALHAKPIR